MSISGISVNSIVQDQNEVTVNFTISGTGQGYVSLFFRTPMGSAIYSLIRVHQLSGDFGLVQAGSSKILKWTNPYLELPQFDGSLSFCILVHE